MDLKTRLTNSAKAGNLARLSHFKAIVGYFDPVFAGKPSGLNQAYSEFVKVKTYALFL